MSWTVSAVKKLVVFLRLSLDGCVVHTCIVGFHRRGIEWNIPSIAPRDEGRSWSYEDFNFYFPDTDQDLYHIMYRIGAVPVEFLPAGREKLQALLHAEKKMEESKNEEGGKRHFIRPISLSLSTPVTSTWMRYWSLRITASKIRRCHAQAKPSSFTSYLPLMTAVSSSPFPLPLLFYENRTLFCSPSIITRVEYSASHLTASKYISLYTSPTSLRRFHGRDHVSSG